MPPEKVRTSASLNLSKSTSASKSWMIWPRFCRGTLYSLAWTSMFSTAVSSGSEVRAWGITPMAKRTPFASVRISWPAMRAVPEVGGVSVVIMRISVVFPAPLGPSEPKISCCATLKLMSLTAKSSPNLFVRCSTSIEFIICSGPEIGLRPGEPAFLRRRGKLHNRRHSGKQSPAGIWNGHFDCKRRDVPFRAAHVTLRREIILWTLEKYRAFNDVSVRQLHAQFLPKLD